MGPGAAERGGDLASATVGVGVPFDPTTRKWDSHGSHTADTLNPLARSDAHAAVTHAHTTTCRWARARRKGAFLPAHHTAGSRGVGGAGEEGGVDAGAGHPHGPGTAPPASDLLRPVQYVGAPVAARHFV